MGEVVRLPVPGLRVVVEPVADGYAIEVRRWDRPHPAFQRKFAPNPTWACCEAEVLASDTGLDVQFLDRPRHGGAR